MVAPDHANDPAPTPAARPASATALLAEHGSPLWLVDLDQVRERWRAFTQAWESAWPRVEVAYSYKANRAPAILRTVAAEGAAHEVACEAEYELACAVARAPARAIVVTGPAKPTALLERAGRDGAMVVADNAEEIARAAAAGVRRVGLRVALPGVGRGPSHFGIPPTEIPAAARGAARLGLRVEALACHLVSIGFDRPLAEVPRLGGAITVQWPQSPDHFARAARMLAGLAVRLRLPVIDIGGGFPGAPDEAPYARAVAGALGAAGFDGGLVVEPGRAIVSDAVDLACTVFAVKRLPDDRRCVIVDAGTNLVAGALWAWPRIEVPGASGPHAGAALIVGPLSLNVDVLHPAVDLPTVAEGDVLLVRGVGAYHQAASTQQGELRPATVALEGGRWRLCNRRETLEDLLASDTDADETGVGGPARRARDRRS